MRAATGGIFAHRCPPSTPRTLVVCQPLCFPMDLWSHVPVGTSSIGLAGQDHAAVAAYLRACGPNLPRVSNAHAQRAEGDLPADLTDQLEVRSLHLLPGRWSLPR